MGSSCLPGWLPKLRCCIFLSKAVTNTCLLLLVGFLAGFPRVAGLGWYFCSGLFQILVNYYCLDKRLISILFGSFLVIHDRSRLGQCYWLSTVIPNICCCPSSLHSSPNQLPSRATYNIFHCLFLFKSISATSFCYPCFFGGLVFIVSGESQRIFKLEGHEGFREPIFSQATLLVSSGCQPRTRADGHATVVPSQLLHCRTSSVELASGRPMALWREAWQRPEICEAMIHHMQPMMLMVINHWLNIIK